MYFFFWWGVHGPGTAGCPRCVTRGAAAQKGSLQSFLYSGHNFLVPGVPHQMGASA